MHVVWNVLFWQLDIVKMDSHNDNILNLHTSVLKTWHQNFPAPSSPTDQSQHKYKIFLSRSNERIKYMQKRLAHNLSCTLSNLSKWNLIRYIVHDPTNTIDSIDDCPMTIDINYIIQSEQRNGLSIESIEFAPVNGQLKADLKLSWVT